MNHEPDPAAASAPHVPSVLGVVVNYRQPALAAAAARSFARSAAASGAACELVVVDNGSDADSARALEAGLDPASRVLHLRRNAGFAAAVNAAVAHHGRDVDWILTMDSDVELEAGAVRALLAAVEHRPDLAMVATQLRFHDRPDVINSAGVSVDRLGVAADRFAGAPVTAAAGGPTPVFGACTACALVRRTAFQQVGGLDERFFYPLEDVDLAWRLQQAGWRAIYQPAAVVHHRHGASAGHASARKYWLTGRNRVRMLAKNASPSLLRRNLLRMVLYDVAYCAFVLARHRTLAPVSGRLAGLREWRTYRQTGVDVELSDAFGLRAALSRHRGTASGHV